MAVSYNTTAPGDTILDGADKLSWSHTVSSNSNRLLVVGIGNKHWTTNDVTGVTYNAVACTELWDDDLTSGTYNNLAYYLVAPATGANTVEVSFDTAVDECFANSLDYYDVHQSVIFGTKATDHTGWGDSPSCSPASATGEMVFYCLYVFGARTITQTGDGTDTWEDETISGAVGYAAGAGSVTISHTLSASTVYLLTAISIKPSVGAPSGIEVLRRRLEGC